MLESAETLPQGAVRITLRETASKGPRIDEMCLALFGLEAADLMVTRTAMYGKRRSQWVDPMNIRDGR